MLKLDREKYIRIAKTQGLSAAVTALHKEMGAVEYETFEGKDGYQPKLWEELEEIRTFSRELWDIALANPEVLKNPGNPNKA